MRTSGTMALTHGERRASRARGLGIAFAVGAAIACLGSAAPAIEAPAASPAAAPGAASLPSQLRVGIAPNYPPVAFERDGQIVGIEADLAAALAKVLGVKMILVPVAWDDLASALNGNEIDVVMSGVSVTERRKRFAHFTKPYLEVGQMALIRNEDQTKLSKPDAMNQKGVRVGAERLTTGARYVRDNVNVATIVEFNSLDAGLEALRAKQIDYFIHDAPTVWRVTGRYPHADPELIGLYRPLTKEEIAWAVRKEDADTIGAALDRGLLELQTSGMVQEILDRWIPVRKVSKDGATPVP
jgi:ABC-type amino acid transport substrate-binding protein